jgi:hypothetical protein
MGRIKNSFSGVPLIVLSDSFIKQLPEHYHTAYAMFKILIAQNLTHKGITVLFRVYPATVVPIAIENAGIKQCI